MKAISFIIVLCFFFISCSDKKEITNPESESLDYVQGEVAFGLKDSVTLEEVANCVYSLDNISIDNIVSFQYKSNLPQDSMQVIKTIFESKSYIWGGTTKTSYSNSESKILVEFWVKSFKAEDIENWNLLKNRFRLNHSPYYFQLGILKVEVGKEKEWINNLSNSNLFRFVELNGITHAF
ncbi:MAG: hypothetical protein AUK34_10265 [Ignavibacteria bacterium CG2_30_36_16]|nr:MAG: hypothetical protein AUK34_10265 [Ignavibacteria bacterium CG2_30_36_16]PJB00707.1 MAG: hypothetical protein CO127_07515 [Ignavibacteria bacterium CG_4_9_14_3_um_filter_36_18]